MILNCFLSIVTTIVMFCFYSINIKLATSREIMYELQKAVAIHFSPECSRVAFVAKLIYMSLNKNNVYCVIPRSSKPPDTCK